MDILAPFVKHFSPYSLKRLTKYEFSAVKDTWLLISNKFIASYFNF